MLLLARVTLLPFVLAAVIHPVNNKGLGLNAVGVPVQVKSNMTGTPCCNAIIAPL
jgi:hypothetical protein